jgi:hypothetical protein
MMLINNMFKGKKGIVWSELAKWAIIGFLIIVVILAIIGPTREAMASQLDKFFNILRFG